MMERAAFGIPQKPNKVVSYYLRQWKAVAVVCVCGTIYDIALAFGPVCQGRVIDALIEKSSTGVILQTVLLYILVVILIQFCRYWKRFAVRLFANRTACSLRLKVYQTLLYEDPMKRDRENAGIMMTKAVSDVDTCAEGMRKSVTEVFDTGVMMISFFMVMLRYQVRMTLIACTMIPVALLIAELMKKMVYRYLAGYREQFGVVSQKTLEYAEHGLLYRMNGMTVKKGREYRFLLKELEKKAVKAFVLENTIQVFYQSIVMLTVGTIILSGAKLIGDGRWTVGDFTAYLAVFASFALRTSKVGKLILSIQKANVSWHRILPYLMPVDVKGQEKYRESASLQKDVPQSSKDAKRNLMDGSLQTEVFPAGDMSMIDSTLTVSGLMTGYGTQSVLRDIHFTAKKGEILFVTGSVASGKSTLGLVLAGFLPYQGSICLYGEEISGMSTQRKSEKIGYMGQDYQLLSETLYENITLGDEGDITDVIRDVCMEEDIAAFPDGIMTQIGENGVKLSGGQQARLALARTLYHKKDFMILDDPVSAVDFSTAARIIGNLREHYRESIILLITHRMELIGDSDCVMTITDGSSNVSKTVNSR